MSNFVIRTNRSEPARYFGGLHYAHEYKEYYPTLETSVKGAKRWKTSKGAERNIEKLKHNFASYLTEAEVKELWVEEIEDLADGTKKHLPPRKIRVWICSPDDYLFQNEDYIEVTDEKYDEIEKIAREVAFEHIEWGFEEVEDE